MAADAPRPPAAEGDAMRRSYANWCGSPNGYGRFKDSQDPRVPFQHGWDAALSARSTPSRDGPTEAERAALDRLAEWVMVNEEDEADQLWCDVSTVLALARRAYPAAPVPARVDSPREGGADALYAAWRAAALATEARGATYEKHGHVAAMCAEMDALAALRAVIVGAITPRDHAGGEGTNAP